ncbi:MAG: HEAT repeat domain-containing protein, partial [Verrucomicrobiota bacterium]
AAAKGTPPTTWKLSRIIWRAGEMGLADALPFLTKLAGKDPMTDYALAWTLGRLGSPDAASSLQDLRNSADAKVARIATESLLLCLDGMARKEAIHELCQTLPPDLLAALSEDRPNALSLALAGHLEQATTPPNYLSILYQASWEVPAARIAVHEAVCQLPLRPPYFRTLRHLYKAAELRLDAELVGTLAKRFEQERENLSIPSWGRYYQQEMAKENSPFAYSDRTRHYFRRHMARRLERAGELGDATTFITLATGVLMAYDDEHDRQPHREEIVFRWNEDRAAMEEIRLAYDDYASSYSLNALLYGDSPRYEANSKTLHWHCQSGYLPGQPPPEGREEAFPHLWDQAPDALMHLLRHSRCQRIHEFAVKVWRDNPSFASLVETDFLLALLAKPYHVTQSLGLDLARDRFDAESPDATLALAILGTDLEEAHALGLHWLDLAPSLLLQDAEFIVQALLLPPPSVHRGLRDRLASADLPSHYWEARLPKLLVTLLEEEDKDDVAEEEVYAQAKGCVATNA